MYRLLPRLLTVVAVLGAVLTSTAIANEVQDPEVRIDAPTGASTIVQGEITDSESVIVDGLVYSRWTVDVSKTVAGSASGTITVRTEGGFDGQLVHVVSGQPHLEVGDRLQLWLEPVTGEPAFAGDYAPVGGTEAAQPLGASGAPVPQTRDASSNFVLEGFFWKNFNSAVPYRINPNTPDLPGTSEVAPINAAFQTWENDALSDVDFNYVGTTSVKTRTPDGVNAVFWANTNAGYLARTTSYFRLNGEMVEFDVQFNPAWEWTDGKASGKFDVQSVALHEAGHALGLGHPSGSGAIMFATLKSNKVKRNLSNGDQGGIRALYGLPSCEGQLATIAGNDSNNNIVGTPGDDIIDGGGGNDTIEGGGGNDIICGGDGNDQIGGGPGNDRLHGNAGADNLGGGGGNDFIEGNGGDDVIRGGAGNDDLWGLGGDDTVAGDDGDDVVRGGPGNDTVRGDDGDDKVTGSSGNDTLTGASGDDRIFGHEGNDTVAGDGGADRLFGNEGKDVVRGGPGNDTMKGHDGDDKLFGGAGNDLMRGGLNEDLLEGSAGHDNMAGGGAADELVGDDGNDIINGNAGFDELDGGPGNDTMRGGIGNDVLRAGGGNDALDGDDHIDSCNGGGGTDTAARCETVSNVP